MTKLPPEDLAPRALKSRDAIRRRREALATAPHMQRLRAYLARLRDQKAGTFVPDFDPATGGEGARILFLLEKPGPKTVPANGGSGFLSISNNDSTAAAMHGFIQRKKLKLDDCLFGNVIPWWNGTIEIAGSERADTQKAITDLLKLLPKLRCVVLVGKTAQTCWNRAGVEINEHVGISRCMHPSPLNRASRRAEWEKIPDSWPNLAET